MKRLLAILMCLFLIIGTAPAQRRDGQHRKPRTTTVQKRPDKSQSKPVVKKPKYDKHPPHAYKPHKPKHPKHIPYDVMPYKMRKYLNKHYHGHEVVRYVMRHNIGYIDGHDCYYEVYLTNGVILIFSTNYNIIH